MDTSDIDRKREQTRDMMRFLMDYVELLKQELHETQQQIMILNGWLEPPPTLPGVSDQVWRLGGSASSEGDREHEG